MLVVQHRIKIGSDTWSSTRNSRLLSLRCNTDLRVLVNECAITLTYPKGISAEPGDTVKVELGHNDQLETVFTGIIGSAEAEIDRLIVRAVGAARSLLLAQLNLFFEKTAAGDIVSDICGQLDVPTGKVDSGLDFSYYALGSNQSAADHIRYLSGLCGFDLFADEKDQLVFAEAKGSEHAFEYGVNVLALQLANPAPGVSGVEVFGDSASGKQGTDAAYWISKNAIKSTEGDKSVAMQTAFAGSARTEEHTQKIAKAYLKQRQAKKKGVLLTLGAAKVRLGDTLNISKMPLNSQNGKYRVTGITHSIKAEKGFVTQLKIEASDSSWSL